MAIGNIFRFPKKNSDGSIEINRVIIDEDGNRVTITESVIDSNASSSEAKPNHIVDISDQLSHGKYTYIFVNSSGEATAASGVFRIYYNGVNFTTDVTVSSDGYSFTFPDSCPDALFDDNNTLLIDFVEK